MACPICPDFIAQGILGEGVSQTQGSQAEPDLASDPQVERFSESLGHVDVFVIEFRDIGGPQSRTRIVDESHVHCEEVAIDLIDDSRCCSPERLYRVVEEAGSLPGLRKCFFGMEPTGRFCGKADSHTRDDLSGYAGPHIEST